jgi:hypothetical protein
VVARGRRCDALPALTTNETNQDPTRAAADLGTGGRHRHALSIAGKLVNETFGYDGGRQVTVYAPPGTPEAVVFAGDGQLTPQWGKELEAADVPSTAPGTRCCVLVRHHCGDQRDPRERRGR